MILIEYYISLCLKHLLEILGKVIDCIFGHRLKKAIDYKKVFESFIQDVKNSKVEKIAERMHYPYNRMYPLLSINTKKEFIQKYSVNFGDSLKRLIVKSEIDIDWSKVGWRGIILNRGGFCQTLMEKN